MKARWVIVLVLIMTGLVLAQEGQFGLPNDALFVYRTFGQGRDSTVYTVGKDIVFNLQWGNFDFIIGGMARVSNNQIELGMKEYQGIGWNGGGGLIWSDLGLKIWYSSLRGIRNSKKEKQKNYITLEGYYGTKDTHSTFVGNDISISTDNKNYSEELTIGQGVNRRFYVFKGSGDFKVIPEISLYYNFLQNDVGNNHSGTMGIGINLISSNFEVSVKPQIFFAPKGRPQFQGMIKLTYFIPYSKKQGEMETEIIAPPQISKSSTSSTESWIEKGFADADSQRLEHIKMTNPFTGEQKTYDKKDGQWIERVEIK